MYTYLQVLLSTRERNRRWPDLRVPQVPLWVLLPKWYWVGMETMSQGYIQQPRKPVQGEALVPLMKKTFTKS